MLLIAQFRDAMQFFSLMYRSDIQELGLGTMKDYIMTEDQFEILEQFTADQLKVSKDKEKSALLSQRNLPEHQKHTVIVNRNLVKTKDFIIALRKRVGVTPAITKILFEDEA